MKKFFSITAAVMAASLVMAGVVNSFAADEQTIVGKWKYQEANGNTTVDKDAKDNGIVEVKDDATFTYTDAEGKTTTGTVETGTEEIANIKLQTVNFYDGETFCFGGYYRSDSGEISIGNGGMARLIRDNGNAETTTTSTEESTTSSATTTKAASSSPKTGVAFPALAVTGITAAAVALAFTLKKDEE